MTYDDWKLMTPEEDHQLTFGRRRLVSEREWDEMDEDKPTFEDETEAKELWQTN